MSDKRTAIQRAVDKAGSPAKLAAAIGRNVLRQHVENWRKAGRVPADHCAAVSRATGIPVWELRPHDWQHVYPWLIGTPGAPKREKKVEPRKYRPRGGQEQDEPGLQLIGGTTGQGSQAAAG